MTARGMKEEDAIKVLQDINRILGIQEIRYWIDAGLLLGAVRDGKIIPWDTDIDFGILYGDTRELLQRISAFKRGGYTIHVTDNLIYVVRGSIAASFIIYQPKGEVCFRVYRHSPNFCLRKLRKFYDMATYREFQSIHGKTMKLAYFFSTPRFMRRFIRRLVLKLWEFCGEYHVKVIPKHFYENLDVITFYGMKFNTPSPVEDYLAFRYGEDWLKPKPNWNHLSEDGSVFGLFHSRTQFKEFSHWYILKDLLDSDF